MMDYSRPLKELRDSVQQTVYDLNMVYENCNDVDFYDLCEEIARITGDLFSDSEYLLENLKRFKANFCNECYARHGVQAICKGCWTGFGKPFTEEEIRKMQEVNKVDTTGD